MQGRWRGIAVGGLLAMALSACGGSADDKQPQADDELGKDLLAPPPAVIPDRFIGPWDASAAACALERPGAMRLVIEPGLMRFHEALVKVQEVHPVAEDRAVDVDATSTGEGVMESRRYRLTPAGKTGLDVTVDGTKARRVRCATAGE